ncbi:MAG: hypothetical protein KAQ96_08705, partial [Thermoplasmata archaeon]|nr:hypothetical protein [Thermoplasmata archaeon]
MVESPPQRLFTSNRSVLLDIVNAGTPAPFFKVQWIFRPGSGRMHIAVKAIIAFFGFGFLAMGSIF